MMNKQWHGKKDKQMNFLSDDHDLRDTFVQVGRREIKFESLKRRPIMTDITQN